MATASDLAEWWEENRKYTAQWSDRSLSEFVDAHSNWFGIAVATTAQTLVEFPMAIGAGFVDILNLGKGAAEGGWGYLQDGLRFVSAIAPLARGGQAIISRVLAMGNLNNCTWIAAAKSLQITGARPFALVGDLAKAAGIRTSATAGAYVHEIVSPLRQLGANVRYLRQPKTMSDVVQAAQANPNGVVLFSVKWSHQAFGGEVGHTLVAGWNAARQCVVLSDRYGKQVRTLAELESTYPGIAGALPSWTMAFVENALITQARIVAGGVASSLLDALALEVKVVFSPPPEIVDEAKQQRAAQATGQKYVVRRGDSLSKIAKCRYGEMYLWPLIYDANRATIGQNPNLILPGQELLVPDSKSFTPAQLDEYRGRGRNWKAYNNN